MKQKKTKKKYIKPDFETEVIKEKVLLQCGKCVAGFSLFVSACKSLPRFS